MAKSATSSQAIWGVIRTGPAGRDQIQVAGTGWDGAAISPELGISDDENPLYLDTFELDSRVGVIHQTLGRDGLLDDSFVFVFIATPNDGSENVFFVPGLEFSENQGLWSVQVDVVDDEHVDLVEGNTFRYRVRPPIPVVQLGATTDEIGIEGVTGTVTGLSIYDPVAVIDDLNVPEDLTLSDQASQALLAGSHRVAMWLTFSSGHAFAVHRLTQWYKEGIDPQPRLPHLATYLGHKDIHSTLVYLTATHQLLIQANERFHRIGARVLASTYGEEQCN